MIALKVLEVKAFMGKLFQKNDFDGFLLSEAEVQTAAGYKINGHRSRSFYTEEEFAKLPETDFLRWEELKPLVFQMIRGSRTPQQLSVVFRLPGAKLEELRESSCARVKPEEIEGAYLNIRFQAGELRLVTAVGYQTFVADKALEREFDFFIREFLKAKELVFEEM